MAKNEAKNVGHRAKTKKKASMSSDAAGRTNSESVGQ